jgi:uncharacterized protein (DUF1778 family)
MSNRQKWIVSIQISPEERMAITEAARAQDVSFSRFFRLAALAAARQEAVKKTLTLPPERT